MNPTTHSGHSHCHIGKHAELKGVKIKLISKTMGNLDISFYFGTNLTLKLYASACNFGRPLTSFVTVLH